MRFLALSSPAEPETPRPRAPDAGGLSLSNLHRYQTGCHGERARVVTPERLTLPNNHTGAALARACAGRGVLTRFVRALTLDFLFVFPNLTVP